MVADYDGDKKADPAVYDAANHRVRALIAGAEITLATIPSNASVVPAFPYALRANYHRLYFLGLCLVGRYSTSANPPIPRSQMCPPPPVAFDFDGDQTADIAWTDASGAWNRLGGTSPFFTGPQYSARAPGDYDGSGAWEPTAIDQPADTPIWITPTQSIPYALPSFTIAHYPDWYGGGSVGNPILPVPGRYDGFDHRTLPAYYVIASGKWYVEGHPTVTLGTTPAADGDLGWDVPVPGDYRGAGRDDFVVYRPTDSTFRGWLGTAIQVGQPGDRPAPRGLRRQRHGRSGHLPPVDRRVVHRRPAHPIPRSGGGPP